MSKIRCIIVEDEPLAVKVLADYVLQVPFLELKGTFKDALLASDFLRQNAVELIFLDIHLPKLKGMAFLRTLIHPPAVIITTAYHQYAVEGFDLNVTDYLLKPFGFERFLAAVNKLRTSQTLKHDADPAADRKDFVFLNVRKRKVKVLFSAIAYVESQKEYVRIVTASGEYVSKMSTHEFEALLPGSRFRRIHRSFIVALDKIESYTADTVEINGMSLPIGRAYKNVLTDL